MRSRKPRLPKMELKTKNGFVNLTNMKVTHWMRRISDSEITAVNLDTFMRRMSAEPVREVDSLIKQLQVLREKLVSDGNRVERRIVDYTAMGNSVSQLTKIVFDGVSRLKDMHD